MRCPYDTPSVMVGSPIFRKYLDQVVFGIERKTIKLPHPLIRVGQVASIFR
jgi:hypothetical protein